MKAVVTFLLLATWAIWLPHASIAMANQDTQGNWQALSEKAEAFFADGSFQKAQETFSQALASAPESEYRWLTVREADSRLRSLDSAQSRDASAREAAIKNLSDLCPNGTQLELRDRVWAEAHEALADHYLQPRRSWGFGNAWSHYQQALDWWGASSDLELARQRWFGIVWKAAWPAWRPDLGKYGEHELWIPTDVLEQGLKIAKTEAQRLGLQYMIARNCMHRGNGPWWDRRMHTALDTIRAAGPRSPYFEHAIWHEAQWLEHQGPWVRDEQGHAHRKPDPAGALEGYRAIVQGTQSGKSPYHKAANDSIKRIVSEELSLHVSQAFLTGSKAGYSIQARNLEEVELTLYPIRLHAQVELDQRKQHAHDWLAAIDTDGSQPAARWKVDTRSTTPHQRVGKTLAIDGDLRAGAYLLVASASGNHARALVLVTEASVTLKSAGEDMYAWVTDARTGKPIESANVHTFARIRDRKSIGSWQTFSSLTPANGLAHLQAPESKNRHEYFVSVETSKGPAFALLTSYTQSEADSWTVHVVTDRPAYRPEQLVQWKLTARIRQALEYTTPAGRKLTAKLMDPRGGEVDKAEVTLTAFGSAFGSFETGADMPLGQYSLQLIETESGNTIASANLFRLEEYKRPEFEVTVQTSKDEEGRAAVFVLGDEVQADVQARTYFGTPVAGAKVELVVYRTPYHASPTPRGRFQWFTESLIPEWERHGRHRSWGREEIERKELITDAEGICQVKFNTPFGQGQDYQYAIEARVTDASRREVTGNGSVRVRRQAYTAELESAHRIHRPGGQMEINVHTLDANDAPLAVDGTLHLYRARWVETWASVEGKRVPDSEVKRTRALGQFPPPGWVLKRSQYLFEEVASVQLRTDAEGKAQWTPTLPSEGMYQVRWISNDPRSGEVTSELWTYAIDAKSTQLASKSNGLQILLDKDTIAEGEPAQIMILSDATDRYVLFSIEAEEVMHIEVLHLTGNVKLVTIPLTQQHAPNVFLTATEVRGGNIHSVSEKLIVPPKEHFLDVQVALDKEIYRPGSDGSFQVTVLDSDGKPVEAEVSLSLFDGSLLAIAPDQIADPRAMFWSKRRDHRVSSSSSFRHLSYTTLVVDDNGRLMTPEELQNKEAEGAWDFRDDSRGGLPSPVMSPAPMQSESRAGVERSRKAMSQNFDGGLALGRSLTTESLSADGADEESSPLEGNQPTDGDSGTVTIRSDFRETAVWLPSLMTDAKGKATGTFTLPDSTTRWQLNAFGNDEGDRFGQLRESAAHTELPLILRPQMPRFLVRGDSARISALLTNTTDGELPCGVSFEAEGLKILGHFVDGELRAGTKVDTLIPAHGDTRIDFLVEPLEAEVATMTFKALSDEIADAVIRTMPIIEHGIEVFVADNGRLTEASLEHEFNLPKGVPGRMAMHVGVSPSIATTMLDALPYLTHYPYGCLEQSLSRFVPTVVAMRTLEQLGLDPEFVASASFGGIEVEHEAKTNPLGREHFKKFNEAASAGLAKIEGQQNSDGSWSWWPGGSTNYWMTGYAAWSLALAKEANMDVSIPVLQKALQWIERSLIEEGQSPDQRAWMLHAACSVRRALAIVEASEFLEPAFQAVYSKRQGLSPYGRALLTLCAKELDKQDELPTLIDNLANGVTLGSASTSAIAGTSGGLRGQTAHWGTSGVYWRWTEGAVESTAFTLRALLAVDPQNELVVPAMNWLVQNRRGAQWKSTRDTAITVLSLCDYLRVSGEASEPVGIQVWVDGEMLGERTLEGVDLLKGSVEFPIANPSAGKHQIRIERTTGTGPLYWTVAGRVFSAEEPIQARASEVFIRRDVYRLVGRETLLKGKVYDRVQLTDGGEVRSGERLEVVLTIDCPNDLEYLMVRDNKPAGLEATVLQSGGGIQAKELRSDEVSKRFGAESSGNATRWATGDAALWDTIGLTGHSRWLYRELRDQAQVFFADSLPSGTWQIRTTLRAEVPGTYHGLPAIAQAMYVPEIRGNSVELRVTVAPE